MFSMIWWINQIDFLQKGSILMHLEVFSIAPLLDENFFQKSFDLPPGRGTLGPQKRKNPPPEKSRGSLSYARRRTSGPRAFWKWKCLFPPFPWKKEENRLSPMKSTFLTFPTVGCTPSALTDFLPQVSISRRKRRTAFITAERCFTEGEQALIREQGPEMFTRIWARKESYLKFTGQGIRVPLNSFEVLPGEQTLPVFFQEFTLEGYRIALCSEEEMAVSLKFLTLEELLF